MAAKKTKKKKKEEENEQILKAKVLRWWDNAHSSRAEIDWKWFVYDLWVAGYHYAKWDRNTQQIVSTIRDKGKPKIVINKIYMTLRAVRNYALRNKPKAEVSPEDLDPENVVEAKNTNKYLDYIHDRLRLRYKLKATFWNALKQSVGFWKVYWDENAEDGKGEIAVDMVDPYDLYFDPLAIDVSDARYVFLAVRRNIWDLKYDDKYIKEEVEKIKDEQKLAASSLKERLLSSEKGLTMYPNNKSRKDDEGSVIVKECWYKEKSEDGDEKIMICTIAGDRIIRKPEDTGLDRLPFFKLPSDIDPMSMYGQGWVKNLIPINRLINRNESSLAEYNDLMNKVKIVMDKGAGVRVINNEHGQIIEKKRGYDFRQLTPASLNPAIYQQIENANRYMEDLGGAHDASMGRIPPGAKSGRALEALQVGDANNMSELTENVELFLEEVYEYILSLAADHYKFARNISPISTTGEREYITLIGESAKNVPEGATVLRKKNIVDVKISSWLAHTSLARQEILQELYQLQVIDKQTLLEGYQIGAVADIINRTNQEREERMAEEVAVQRAGEEQPQQAGAQQAIAAIRSIINGQQPPPIENVSPEFVQYFDQFLQSQEAQSLGGDVLQQLQAFRDSLV